MIEELLNKYIPGKKGTVVNDIINKHNGFDFIIINRCISVADPETIIMKVQMIHNGDFEYFFPEEIILKEDV